MPSGPILPRFRNHCLLAKILLWKLKTCSRACFSKSLRVSFASIRVNKYSICSIAVGLANGPRRTTASISGERLLCRGHRLVCEHYLYALNYDNITKQMSKAERLRLRNRDKFGRTNFAMFRSTLFIYLALVTLYLHNYRCT